MCMYVRIKRRYPNVGTSAYIYIYMHIFVCFCVYIYDHVCVSVLCLCLCRRSCLEFGKHQSIFDQLTTQKESHLNACASLLAYSLTHDHVIPLPKNATKTHYMPTCQILLCESRMHACMHTYKYTYTHIHIHTYLQTCTDAHTHRT